MKPQKIQVILPANYLFPDKFHLHCRDYGLLQIALMKNGV